jgi:hypothetical protein
MSPTYTKMTNMRYCVTDLHRRGLTDDDVLVCILDFVTDFYQTRCVNENSRNSV